MVEEKRQPTVLFLCTQNAGRSPMAAAYMQALGNGKVTVLSAGPNPKDSINPVAVAAMAEDGIDISNYVPKKLTDDSIEDSDVVITMGCGDSCPLHPGKRYEDWAVEDTAGKPLADLRSIRDDIKHRVEKLLSELV